MGRIDEQEVPSVSDNVKAKKRKFDDILCDFTAPFSPYQNLRFEDEAPQFIFTPEQAEDPRWLFGYFFTQEDFEEIARNTNKNAASQYAEGHPKTTQKHHGRAWYPTNASELKIWLGILLYMGIHRMMTRSLGSYWNTNPEMRIDPSLHDYMGRDRWQQIQRYFKVSDLDEEAKFNVIGKDWWRKVAPLTFRFRDRCKKAVLSATHCSIDELLEKFEGRSKHTLQIDTKAAGKGYKIYALNLLGGYLVDYRYTSKATKIAEVHCPPGKRATSQMILDMMTTLPPKPFREGYASYVVWLDNFFTTADLLIQLRKKGIGAAGTCKAGSGVPQSLIDLRQASNKKHYGVCRTMQIVEQDEYEIPGTRRGSRQKKTKRDKEDGVRVLCGGWQDNNLVLFMTTVHSEADFDIPGSSKPFKRRKDICFFDPAKKRGDDIVIPTPIDQYNHHMGFTDLHAQLEASYTCYHRLFRSWWPLFFQIVNSSVTNAWVASRAYPNAIPHYTFQLRISQELRREGLRELQFTHLLCPSLALKRVKWPSHSLEVLPEDTKYTHTRVKLARYGPCAVCKREGFGGVKGQRNVRMPLGELDINLRRPAKRTRLSHWGCDVCRVPLCNNEQCWNSYHSSFGGGVSGRRRQDTLTPIRLN